MEKMKVETLAALGVLGAAMAKLLGGWDMALQTLIGFMVTDYLTGMAVAAVFHKSVKTEGGALSSAVGMRGLFKKSGMLLVVYIACCLDAFTASNYVRDMAVTALIANELVSITENLGLMGVPLPKVVTGAVEMLMRKEESDDQAGN